LQAQVDIMTTTHPIQLSVEPPAQMQRVHVAIRLLLLLALAAIGNSSVYWLLYLVLPAVAALLIAQKGGDRYLREDEPGIARALRWLAGAYAYLWLLTDELPTRGGTAIELKVEPGSPPSATSALSRIVLSLPALLLLALLSIAACIAWLIGAAAILIRGSVPAGVADFLATTLRYQFRLIAYHLSLTDRYPSLEEAGATHAPVAP
jgi:hypothetical protein